MLKIKFKGLLKETEKRRDYSGKVLELVEKLPEGFQVNIEVNSKGTYDIYNFDYDGPKGDVGMAPLGDNSSGKDPDAYEIVGSQMNDDSRGWGPLFYDIALEIASMESRGLTSDREGVSGEARSVWERYCNNRTDVAEVEADVDLGHEFTDKVFKRKSEPGLEPTDYIAQITPEDPSDDIVQISALKHKGFEKFFDSVRSDKGSAPKFKEWSDSPLSRIYRKEGPPVVLKALKDKGAFGTEETPSIPQELWDAIN